MKPNTDQPKMMMNTTLNQLRSLRLETMAQALEQQLQQSGISAATSTPHSSTPKSTPPACPQWQCPGLGAQHE